MEAHSLMLELKKCLLLGLVCSAHAASLESTAVGTLEGDLLIHDPSTIVRRSGHHWVFGTGWGDSLPVFLRPLPLAGRSSGVFFFTRLDHQHGEGQSWLFLGAGCHSSSWALPALLFRLDLGFARLRHRPGHRLDSGPGFDES